MNFLNTVFYHNTIKQWLIAVLLVVASVLLAKLVVFVFKKIIKKTTKKTKTQIDDYLASLAEKPIVFAVFLTVFWIAIKTLTLPTIVENKIEKAFFFLILFDVAWFLSKVIDSVYKNYLVPKALNTETKLDEQVLPILHKGIKYGLWIITIVVGLNNAGYDVGALLAGLGIGGLAFALAAKDSISNMFGGLTIFLDKTFKINDRVIVNGIDGFVREIGLRSTRIETLQGRTIVLPNSTFATSPVENISSEPTRKNILNLGLTYDTTPEQMQQAISLLKQIAVEVEQVEDNSICIFDSYGDFSLNIKFIYYIKKGGDIFETTSKVNMLVLERFNANNLEFAFPTQTLYNINQSMPKS